MFFSYENVVESGRYSDERSDLVGFFCLGRFVVSGYIDREVVTWEV